MRITSRQLSTTSCESGSGIIRHIASRFTACLVLHTAAKPTYTRVQEIIHYPSHVCVCYLFMYVMCCAYHVCENIHELGSAHCMCVCVWYACAYACVPKCVQMSVHLCAGASGERGMRRYRIIPCG